MFAGASCWTLCLVEQLKAQPSGSEPILECRSVPNTPKGCARIVTWAQDTNTDRVAIEGSGNYSRPAALMLIEAGCENMGGALWRLSGITAGGGVVTHDLTVRIWGVPFGGSQEWLLVVVS